MYLTKSHILIRESDPLFKNNNYGYIDFRLNTTALTSLVMLKIKSYKESFTQSIYANKLVRYILDSMYSYNNEQLAKTSTRLTILSAMNLFGLLILIKAICI